MAQTISINLKDANYTKALDAVALATGWTETILNPAFVEGGAEPATIPNITKDVNLKRWLKDKVRNEILEQANRVALATVVVDGDL